MAFQYTNKFGADKVRVLTLVKNRGKGGAVRMVRTPMEYIYTRSKKTKSNVYKKIQIIYILFIIIIYFYNSPIRSPFYGGQKMVAPVGVKPLTLPFELERTT